MIYMKKVKRISVIGGSGTGKTTLTDNLGKQLKIRVYHLDGYHHLKNWKIRDAEERDKMILNVIKKDKWIMDGTYTSTLEERLKRSDLIIYLDYSSLAQLKGVLGRYIKHHGKEKKDIPGCKEKFSPSFWLWVLKWKRKVRHIIIEEVEKVDKSNTLIFKNRKQLNEWYLKEFKVPIETD